MFSTSGTACEPCEKGTGSVPAKDSCVACSPGTYSKQLEKGGYMCVSW